MAVGLARRLLDGLKRHGGGAAVGDVLADGDREERRLLRQPRHQTPQLRLAQISNLHAVEHDPPLGGRVEAQRELEQRRLARARAADDGEPLAGGGAERHVVENRRGARRVAEGDAVELEAAARRRLKCVAFGRLKHFVFICRRLKSFWFRRRRLEEGEDFGGGAERLLDARPLVANVRGGGGDEAGVEDERSELGRRQLPAPHQRAAERERRDEERRVERARDDTRDAVELSLALDEV